MPNGILWYFWVLSDPKSEITKCTSEDLEVYLSSAIYYAVRDHEIAGFWVIGVTDGYNLESTET